MQNNVSAILCNNKEPLRHLAFKILDDPCSLFLTRIKPQENSLVAVIITFKHLKKWVYQRQSEQL